ncbi:MAG: exo-alpha-sialidase [Victivallales bacterium]|nr:exo-alpha-sialidase [Victivallales bacterium]
MLKSCSIHKFDETVHGVNMRLWQGCPTVAITPGGRLFAGWYSGGSIEPSIRNYSLLQVSDDGGLTWSKPLLVIEGLPKDNIQQLDVQLWMDPLNRLWVCWTQRNWNIDHAKPNHLSCWAVICDNPDAKSLSFSKPFYLCDGFLRCQPTALSDGRWLFCAYNWLHDHYAYYETSDSGKTFRACKAGKRLGTESFDETMILERRDGSLWMLARTVGIGKLAECISCDGGKTWSGAMPSEIPTPSTRFFLKRLKSGRVLLVNNNSSTRRNNMTAFLSEDDGRTWSYSILLDKRTTSYPDVAEDSNGDIYIIWDRERQAAKEILLSRIRERDIIAGELIEPSSYLCNIVSKASAPSDVPNVNEIIAADKRWLKAAVKTAFPNG